MATCDPETLLESGKCLQCMDEKTLNVLKTQLLCEIYSAGPGGGSNAVEVAIACSDETTALAVASAVATFRMPFAMTVTDVRSSLTTAPTGAPFIVDINESGSSILGGATKLWIDATEKTSTTASFPVTISDPNLADDAEMTIDIDQIGSGTAGAGLKVVIIGTRA